MKIHYNNAINPEKHNVPACGTMRYVGKIMITSIPEMVTCERCRKMVDLPGKAAKK